MEASHSFSASKLGTACFVIRRLSSVLGIDAIKTAHYVYFPSLIQYYIIFLGNSSNVTEVFLLAKGMIKNYDASNFKIF